jgi:16S rRNA (guanine966-N2)-methyltransferase
MPRDATFRPTTDRVKESVFNVLAGQVEWSTESVCDLYAGSGNLGLEALSRGAAHTTFVERSKGSLTALERNIESLDVVARTAVLRMTVEQYFRKSASTFSLIFADPPYAEAAFVQLLDGIAKLLRPEGLAIIEHGGKEQLVGTPELTCIDRRDYGTTAVSFFRSNQGGAL